MELGRGKAGSRQTLVGVTETAVQGKALEKILGPAQLAV